jgi:hypothetical protein
VAAIAIGVLIAGGLTWTFYGRSGSGAMMQTVQNWAAALNTQGYEISAGKISGSKDGAVVHDFVVANPAEGWRWTGPRAVVAGTMRGEGMTIRVSGEQRFDYQIAGGAHSAVFSAEAFLITIEPNNDGGVGAVIAQMARGVLARGDDDPILIARGEIRLDRAGGTTVIPNSSVISLQFDNVLMPNYRRSAFGDLIKRFFAVVELQLGLDGLDPGAQIVAWQRAPRAAGSPCLPAPWWKEKP